MVILSNFCEFNVLSQSQETWSRTTPDFLAHFPFIKQFMLFCPSLSSEREMQYHFEWCLYWLEGRRTHDIHRGLQAFTMDVASSRTRMA